MATLRKETDEKLVKNQRDMDEKSEKNKFSIMRRFSSIYER